MNVTRLKELRSRVSHPLLIKKKENLFYLLGHLPMDGWLLVDSRRAVFLGSGLEKIAGVAADKLKNLDKHLDRHRSLSLEDTFTFAEAKFLQSKCPNVKFSAVRSPVDEMRQIKGAEELRRMKASAKIVEKVWRQVRKDLRRQVWNEINLAHRIIRLGESLGAEDVSFYPIVASGPNAAIPHHRSGKRNLRPGETLVIDFGFSAGGGSASGGKYRGYCSDFTRTVFLKRVSSKLAGIYNQVEKAYLESITFIESSLRGAQRRGNPVGDTGLLRNDARVKAAEVHKTAVSVLAEKKLDKYFIHNLGHGCGLEIHEAPDLAPASKAVLQNGMVFSIEPGVYLPKLGGVRIEDLVYLRNGKARRFFEASTKLQENIL